MRVVIALLGLFAELAQAGLTDATGLGTRSETLSYYAANNAFTSASTYRHGEYFWKELTAGNSLAATNVSVTNQAVLGSFSTNRIGRVLVDRANVALRHDAEGNLTNDGRWSYWWDAENRLIRVESTTNIASIARQRIEFLYDALGRRVQKRFATNNVGTWVFQNTNRYIHDGDLIVAEVDHLNRPQRSYVWGPGDEIHGPSLAMVIDHTAGSTGHFAVTDGSGHVTDLIAAGSGAPSARYEYAPFGEMIRASGAFAALNPIRFASQFTDEETGQSAFRYRVFSPSSGRWLSRDPLGEIDGPNLYAYVGNDPVNGSDPLGLWNLFNPASWGVRNAAGWSVADSFNPLHESASWDGYSAEFYRQSVASATGLTGLLGDYDPCDPLLAKTRLLGRGSMLLLSVFGPGKLAGWASGPGLLRAGTALGLEGWGLYESASAAGTGIGHLSAGDPIGLFEAGVGAIGLKGGLGQIGARMAGFRSAAGNLFRGPAAKSGVWSLGPGPRGLAIESQLGGNLPAGFRVIDRFENGVATSIKSIDLNASTYQNARALGSKLNGYVDSLAGWTGQTTPYGGGAIQPGQVTARTLQVAVPPGSMSAAQQAVFNAAAQRAQAAVNFIVTPVP